ncbi:MAG TPA: methyltransferase domain-containing protein [Desulfuromonadales bacterium]|nr:methyltransferase domain-containing protein [Desulfuromonadales bacterium]
MTRDFKNRVRERFGRAAEGYIRDAGFSTGGDLDAMVELLQPSHEDNMLDVACGGGHTALRFAPLVRSVVASDLSMVMLKKAQEYVSEEGGVDNVIFREADAEDLPFPAGAFTLLTCRIAPHHFPDVPRALTEFHRVLRRGGRLAIVDTLLPDDPEIAAWHQEMERMRDPTHIQAFTEAEWTEMVTKVGFTIHQTAIFRKTHDFPAWAVRGGMNRDAIAAMNKLFFEAPNKVQDYFQIEAFAGEVETYTDKKLLIYASRPSKK